MRTPVKLLSLGAAMAALAIAAFMLWPHGKQVAPSFDHIANDLCIVAPATPFDSASVLGMLDPKLVPAEARCPVCGMYPARYPRWAAQAVFRDGAAHFFDSPVDLFAFLQRVDRHDRRYTRNDVAVSYVSDYATGKWIEDRRAFFVYGSRVLGPMRDADLPAFSSRKEADAMSREHGGKVLEFAEVTPELIRSLNRNLHHRH